jgi:hypothetical protein
MYTKHCEGFSKVIVELCTPASGLKWLSRPGEGETFRIELRSCEAFCVREQPKRPEQREVRGDGSRRLALLGVRDGTGACADAFRNLLDCELPADPGGAQIRAPAPQDELDRVRRHFEEAISSGHRLLSADKGGCSAFESVRARGAADNCS